MVNFPKVTDMDYINFILASQRIFTCTEAARSLSADEDGGPSHDAFTRLLQRMPKDTETLWSKAKPLLNEHGGALVIDDTTLDKPYSAKMGLVTYHWSGKHRSVVKRYQPDITSLDRWKEDDPNRFSRVRQAVRREDKERTLR